MLRSVPLFFVLCTVALMEAEAWMVMQTSIMPRGPSPLSLAPRVWNIHLDLAKDAYRKRHWGKVKQICSRVINVALDSHTAAAVQDWAAVEEAHLRLALAEQQDKQVDAARRTFQRGTAACPSSDTLFMAWALMESKIHSPRSRKVARALLRRAVSLNPKRHSNILRWRVFLDLKGAGEAAGEAAGEIMCSTLTTSPPVTSSSSTNAAAPATTAVTAKRTSRTSRTSSTPRVSNAGGVNGKSSPHHGSSGSASSSPHTDFITRWAMRTAAIKERSLSSELLALCVAATKAKQEGRRHGNLGAETKDYATRLENAIRSLENLGRGHVGDTTHGRVLSGSWRLAYTNCPVCERVLTLEGLEFYQHLSAPIREIAPKAGEPPVPLRCEVVVAPSADAQAKGYGRPSVSHFLRGWAQARISGGSGKLKLRQQVAPRRSAKLTAGYRPGSFGEPLPPALPPAALRALGDVVRGGAGFEKLVTQDVSYIGGRLRMGRTKDGKVFVYERCMWPRDQCL